MPDEQKPRKPAEPPNRADDDEAISDEDVIEEASMESFPASDPPSWSPTRSGTPRRPKKGGDAHQ
jgi:hypothetical protein